MSTTTKHETEIGADPKVPTITIVREFDATPERLYRAWTDPELAAQWMGPRSVAMRIDEWECRTGGRWRYTAMREGEAVAGFFGSFHEVRADRIVQTFTFEGYPDGVALETVWFEDLGDGRARVRTMSLCDTFEGRDAMLSSGMDVGVNEGYEKLDELLASEA